ncbi:type II toxin-antitoxin system prevent-host-death family antitoxin [Streptomyces oceani]|uniref:type II toxin-antitoxin system prevent-host-death family antitoxin n=1 Tax=Streptomyces oceani TaxID=1075402 RepID=UPI001FCD6E29|nr:type II toxin-antitoxin system prevent-host-death family antitoxin [Streptomyces oceani]
MSATREPAVIADHGNIIAMPVSPADAAELDEMRALAAYRERRARGESAAVSREEAFRRILGDDPA